MMLKSDLLQYWPKEKEISACLKTDAEASSEAVSLAVHQPMHFDQRTIGGDNSSVGICDEKRLLDIFTAKNLSEGRVILPIVGTSGVGKSHVIRWLFAQIARMPNPQKRVVIRIPKGTSLKGVLGILLRDLEGPSYTRFRSELQRAQQELDPKEAAGLLCEMLAHTLEEFGHEAKKNLMVDPRDKEAQEIDAYCRPDMLPALLRNQFLRDQHFIKTVDGNDGVARRLVEQLTEERSTELGDDRQHQFTADDMNFDERINRSELGRSDVRALGQFVREDRRNVAARILNAALDSAKQRLLRLDPTVTDLFNAVREQLLKDGKELFLLIEDFVVLSGLQKQILQVIIKEAVRDGKQVLCTMRTALAYTPGYVDAATVLTRANHEFRIPDNPGSDEEILERIERLVGAYLNAARNGQKALESAYRQDSADDDWIPKFKADIEPESKWTLDAFGESKDGYELFPFNSAAIRQLAREGSTAQGRLVYNPRWIIQNVMLRALVHRNVFESSHFPPSEFGSKNTLLPQRMETELQRRVPAAETERYSRFLLYWAGKPDDLEDLATVGPRVFEAFGLNRSIFGPEGKPVVPQPQKKQELAKPERNEEEKKDRSASPLEADWERSLESWRSGVKMPQAVANQLRKWLADGLRATIEWDWDLFKPREDGDVDSWSEQIFLPNAAGSGGRGESDSMASVCSENALKSAAQSAQVVSSVMAVVRFHGVHKHHWRYAGADEDLPRYLALMEKLTRQARAYVKKRYFKSEWDPTPLLVQGLSIGARTLGLEGADKDDHAALLNSIFLDHQLTSTNIHTDDEPEKIAWNSFRNALLVCRHPSSGASWLDHLKNLAGARQGGAGHVHALNLSLLKPAIDNVLKAWDLIETIPNTPGVEPLVSIRSTASEIRRHSSSVLKCQKRLTAWRARQLDWMGSDLEKDTLVRELKAVLEAAKAGGLATGVDIRKLSDLSEEFRQTKVIAAMDDISRIAGTDNRGLILTVLGRDYDDTMRICDTLKVRFDEFANAVEEALNSLKATYGPAPLKDSVEQLQAELKRVDALLTKVEGL